MSKCSAFFLLLGIVWMCTTVAYATPAEFTVDPALSSLTSTSSVLFGGMPLTTTPQGTGSLTTSYSGTLLIDLWPSCLTFLPGSVLIAGNSGNWFPGTDYSNYPADLESPTGYINSAEPANYGIVTDLTPLGAVQGKQGLSPSATRDLEISLYDTESRPLTGHQFDEAGISTNFISGTVYYSSGGAPPVTDLVNTVNPGDTNSVSGSGSLVTVGNIQTLTLPVSISTTYFVNFLVITFELEGTIVATRTLPSITVPGDFDGDHDVDDQDIEYFESCETGPALGPPTCECESADLDGDVDVDQSDFGLLQRCITKDGIVGDPNCLM